MRTTIDIPDELLARAMEASGKKTKRAAVRWALEEAVRRKALEELLALRGKIEFAVTPDELEEREIRDEDKERRQLRRLAGGGR